MTTFQVGDRIKIRGDHINPEWRGVVGYITGWLWGDTYDVRLVMPSPDDALVGMLVFADEMELDKWGNAP
jgi:hypothetical protein